jgi:hypothetical protein
MEFLMGDKFNKESKVFSLSAKIKTADLPLI